MIADTHSHLNWENFQDNLDQILSRAKDSSVGLIIDVGVDILTSKEVSAQSRTINQIPLFAAIGIHPHEAQKYSNEQLLDQDILELKSLYKNYSKKIVAIGECGLDYNFSEDLSFDSTPQNLDKIINLQKKLFKSQARLASNLQLPLIIHCRNSKTENDLPLAWNDIFITELKGTTGVFHNFSSNLGDAQKALDLGFYLSFSCVVTYPKNDHLRELIRQLPIDKIVTETDCPFLPPQQIRGQRNEPFYVSEVVRVIAELKGISYEQASKQTFTNAQKLFIDK